MNSSGKRLGKRFFHQARMEEVSLEGAREPAEQLDQRGQSQLGARLPLHGETRLTIICLALFAVILSLLLFFTTRTMFLLFMTLALTLVLYGVIEAHFSKSERTRP